METDDFSHDGWQSDQTDPPSLPPPIPVIYQSIPPSASSSLPSASLSASPSNSEAIPLAVPPPIPHSVRGAPEELKPAIRKNQNKQSARRSRKRRRELVASLSRSLQLLLHRINNVETRLLAVEGIVENIGFKRLDPLPRAAISLPSASGDLRSADANELQGNRDGRVSSADGADDDEVQRLIDQCMGQL